MPKAKTETKKEVSKRDAVLALLKARMPAAFEREPAPAFAQGNLEALADDLLDLCQ